MSQEQLSIEEYNLLENAKHIFGFCEEDIAFKIVKLIPYGDTEANAIVELESGETEGLFTNSASAKQSLQKVVAAFGKNQPFIKVKTKKTGKNNTVYYVEVQQPK